MPPRRSSRSAAPAGPEMMPPVDLLPDEAHPDYVAGSVSDGWETLEALAPEPHPAGPAAQPLPGAAPQQIALASDPTPLPGRYNFCAPVSGRYRYLSPRSVQSGSPFFPTNLLAMTVRVDVDRFFPQHRISIEIGRRFPRASAHVIAEVTSDACLGYNQRRIRANITYRDGDAALIPGDQVVFEARRTSGLVYNSYTLTLLASGAPIRSYNLAFESIYFDPVELEVDRVENAGVAVTTFDTAAHPTRPANLPAETVSLQTVYQRAGFDVTMSPNTTVIPMSGAGVNGTWSDSEMHNAMVAYWSRFQDRPQWAMWVLFAGRHDMGRSLGGIMFDDIGPNHRQGTAIFLDSFIQDAPAGDANPAAWRQRMVFWTAVHEMGHAFNLAHSWQKSLGTPWVPLGNEPEARSFMNYPFKVAGGQGSFFSDFRFRFSDDELQFMRHAPRRFVQMGNSDWFMNHGFEAPEALLAPVAWQLKIRPNRDVNTYRFLEPVNLELKLTNISDSRQEIEEDMLNDGRHVTIFVAREGGVTRQWRPFQTSCHSSHLDTLKPGESVYGAHLISASTAGWLIDETGFYKVQAAVDMGGEIAISNVLRLYVAPPVSAEESRLAPDYFSEEVGRAIAFQGVPALEKAMNVLREVEERIGDNPAVRHAAVALSAPLLRDYKLLEVGRDPESLAIQTQEADVEQGAKGLAQALLEEPEAAAETLGHIEYFATLDQLAGAMQQAGDESGAVEVRQASVDTMKQRGILPSIIQSAERTLARQMR